MIEESSPALIVSSKGAAMASEFAESSSALAAAGVVGQWTIYGKAEKLVYDCLASQFMVGNNSLADTALPVFSLISLTEGDLRAKTTHYLRNLLRSGGPAVLESHVLSPVAGQRTVQFRGYFAWDENNEMIGRGIVLDVTDFRTHVLVPAPSLTVPASPDPRNLPVSPDPLAEAAERGIELRIALGRSGHGALRLAADLLLFEINVALAERLNISDKPGPNLSDRPR